MYYTKKERMSQIEVKEHSSLLSVILKVSVAV